MRRTYKRTPKYKLGDIVGGFLVVGLKNQEMPIRGRKVIARHIIDCGHVHTFTEANMVDRARKVASGETNPAHCQHCKQRKIIEAKGGTVQENNKARQYELRQEQKEKKACFDIDLLAELMPVRSTNY